MLNAFERLARPAALVWLAAAPMIAQSSSAIVCPACAESGQRADSAAFNPAQVRGVGPIRQFFMDNRTLEMVVIARVVRASPLIVDVLDSRGEMVDRNHRHVTWLDEESNTCSFGPVDAVDAASAASVATLRFNDLITGRIVISREEGGGSGILTAIRRLAPPVRFLHAQPAARCSNRSGVLVQFRGLANDAVTIYNDGAIHYHDPLMRHFDRERLSEADVADLMRAFRAVDFDTLPNDLEPNDAGSPGMTLIAARYQNVAFGENDTRFEPLVRRLTAIGARAMAGTTLVLKARTRQRLPIAPWPFPDVPLAGFDARRQRGLDEHDQTQNVSSESRALEQRLPDALLARLAERLPVEPKMAPDRFVYFTDDDRLYRLSKTLRCDGRTWCENTLYMLNVDEVRTVEDHLRAEAAMTVSPAPYRGPDGRSMSRPLIDPDRVNEYSFSLNYPGPYIWPTDMGLGLAALPPDGATIPALDYERHKAAYLALQLAREPGADLIENGVLFAHVRVCRLERGVVDDCPVR